LTDEIAEKLGDVSLKQFARNVSSAVADSHRSPGS
jgi:hypothetical protein